MTKAVPKKWKVTIICLFRQGKQEASRREYGPFKYRFLAAMIGWVCSFENDYCMECSYWVDEI